MSHKAVLFCRACHTAHHVHQWSEAHTLSDNHYWICWTWLGTRRCQTMNNWKKPT